MEFDLLLCKIMHGDTRYIEEFIKENSDEINGQNDYGATLLHFASVKGDNNIVSMLLGGGASLTLTDTSGYTPLHWAAVNNMPEVVSLMLSCGADINTLNTDGQGPLHQAIQNNYIKVVEVVLNATGIHNVQNSRDATERTPLHVACASGYDDIVKMLLQSVPDINVVDRYGNTPLHLACRAGHDAVVELLKSESTLNVNVVNNDIQNTPLHLACEGAHYFIVDMLLKCGSNINMLDSEGNSPLHLACRAGHTDITKLLLKYKASDSVVNRYGNTVLHVACSAGHSDTVRFLMNSKPNVNVRNIDGSTPLLLACHGGHSGTVALLLQSKPDLNVVNNYGNTPLHVACHGGHSGTVELLLKSKPHLNLVNNYGNTPLRVACGGQHNGTVEQLLKSKPDVNIKDLDGNTLLHLAVLQNNYEMALLILSQDAVRLDIKDSHQRTPFLLAISNGHIGLLHTLASKGAAVDLEDENGNNCLHLAVKVDEFHSEIEHIDILDTICDQLSISVEQRLCGLVVACYLAEYEANFYHKNKENFSPLEIIDNSVLKELLGKFVSTRFECMLCANKQASVTFLPCEHKVICEVCCSKIDVKKCLECRQRITSKVRCDWTKVNQEYKSKEIEEDEDICPICMEHNWNVVFECGHTTCAECAQKITLCHLCRKPIEKRNIVH